MKRLALIGLFALLASCGGKVEEGSSDPTTAGGTPSPTTTTTTVPPSPGQPPGSSGSSGTAPGTPPAPTNPTPGSTKVITAQAVAGGLDHIMIFAADAKEDSCVRIHMTHPFGSSPGNPYAITAMKEWGVQNISRSPGAKRCGGGKQPPAAEESTGAKGTISVGPPVTTTLYPCSINVHVAVVFSDAPTVEQIDGDKIVVEDGCQ